MYKYYTIHRNDIKYLFTIINCNYYAVILLQHSCVLLFVNRKYFKNIVRFIE